MRIISITKGKGKPRVRFCHACSRKLRGNHHLIVRLHGIDHDFIYHKECAENLMSKK